MPADRESSMGEDDLAAQSMNILSSLHAAIVNFHLYPSTSDIVEDSVRRALDELREALNAWGTITFCETEGKLLINDFVLDERDQARANTLAFLKDLALWEVRSLTLERDIEEKELRSFLEIVSHKRSDRALEGDLGDLLRGANISRVKVDEKVYVPVSKEQDISELSKSEEDMKATGLLIDELLVRYLLGNAAIEEISPQGAAELISDPQRIRTALDSAVLASETSGAGAGPQKAQLIMNTLDRMYGLVDGLEQPQLKDKLSGELVNMLATLEPETLAEVLTESAPQVVKESGMRRFVISSLQDLNVLMLTDKIIDKYRDLAARRPQMDKRDYDALVAKLNDTLADLYREGDPAYRPEIARRVRESGLFHELAGSSPQVAKDMEIYAILTQIRTSGSLRTLEGLSDGDVIEVAGKLLDMGEYDIARKIVNVTSRNLNSDDPEFRSRACRFLKEMHRDFKKRGHPSEILSRSEELAEVMERETDAEVKGNLIEFLGVIANDLFPDGRLQEFERVCSSLVMSAEEAQDERVKWAAKTALSSLNPWDVGRPLADSLYGEDEELSRLAARILPYIEESLTAKEIVDHLKDEEAINITPALAQACRGIGEPVLAAVGELMNSNAREEVYLRSINLLELMDGNAALSLVKSAENNPIPIVRAQAIRSMSRMSPGDPSLLPHFLNALNDDDVDVRREGARGLGTIDDPRSVEALLSIVESKTFSGGEEHPRVQEVACLALARLGPEKALAPLSDLLRKRSFSLRRHAVHPRVKAASCYALSRIGGSEVVDLIRDYLDDPDPVLRNEARKAISELRRKGFLD
jgi:HEAT repeat protein